MLDNLRDDSDASPFFEDDELPDFLEGEMEEAKHSNSNSSFSNPVLNLSPIQRFIIAAMLFTTVCLIGSMFLLVTQRFALP